MNLAQLQGSFSSPISLVQSLLKLYFLYDFELVREDDTTLVYDIVNGTATITLKQTISSIIITAGEKHVWNLNDLIQEEVEFPLELKKGEAKNVLVRDGLSEKLTLVKESLLKASSSGTTSGDSTSAKKPKEPAAGKNESPPKKVKQDTQEQYRPIQSSRIQESGSLHISSGGIPHGVGIPPVPLQPQPQVNPMGRFGVGDVDLDPFRAAPGLIPGMPMDPRNRPMNPMNPGGGMHVGPDHPMFQPPLNNPYGPSNPYGPPPGARFDPVMPFGPGGGRPIRPARPGRPPFGGDPDFDEFLPPGNNQDQFM